MPKSQEEVI
jgi:hypothetical protein